LTSDENAEKTGTRSTSSRKPKSAPDLEIGVLIVTHYRLGEEFLQALRLILPEAPVWEAVSVDPKIPVEEVRGAIAAGLKASDKGDGVLILTDMFGGTPSNISLSFHDEHQVEVVTGMNLPMLIKLATLRDEKPLDELATFIKAYGQRNISVASELVPEGDV
jgi:PTS system mannose-specific IIA component